jgi:GNAT superfamily N-acetyltransferase
MSSVTDGAQVGSLRRDLGNGLTLRSAHHDDGAELVEFNATMHADARTPGSMLADWTLDLFETPHPTFRVERDVTVVEDSASGRIVSALFLIPQVWSYAGLPINAGQPELVATHPDYRRRGLIRAQFDVIHDWSRAGGQLWQFIAGIPWYYRQFGYTYAVDLPPRPIMWLSGAPPPPSTEFTLRAATSADVEFLAGLEAEATSGTLLAPLRGTEGFTLELTRRPGGLLACEILVVEPTTAAAAPLGYVAHERRLVDGLVSLRAFELRRGNSWLGPTAALVNHLHHWVRNHPDGPGRGVRLALPARHPATRCASTRLGWAPPGSYGLYVRVPDVVGFVRAIAPVLEARLASSPAVAWTGDLRIDLYRVGLRLRFDEGRLLVVEPWNPPTHDSERAADVSIPQEDFVHLLLGNRSIDELERTTPDCLLHTDTGALMLDVLFPPMPMSTWEFC